MYATVRTYVGGGDLADALLEHESEVKSLMGDIAGFKAYYLIRTADGTVSVTVFDDESGAAESNRIAMAWIKENLPDLAGATPSIAAGEVIIDA